jgi:hypothetical protein
LKAPKSGAGGALAAALAAGGTLAAASPACADYGQGGVYQIELSANVSSPQGGGVRRITTCREDHLM